MRLSALPHRPEGRCIPRDLVNPELVDQRYYGRNVCATAADGLAQLKPLLLQLMAS
jgi:hypothetical protein